MFSAGGRFAMERGVKAYNMGLKGRSNDISMVFFKENGTYGTDIINKSTL